MAKRKLSTKQLAALSRGRKKRAANLRKTKSPVRRKSKSKISTKVKVRKLAKKRTRKSSRKSSKRGMFANVSGILGAVAYGAVREKASNFISNTAIGRKLPVTGFTDEAVMLALNFGARKFGLGKNPVGNSILRAQKTVELARIGEGLNDMFMSGKSNSNGTNSNGLVVLQ